MQLGTWSCDGFGFVKVEGQKEDIFIPMRKLHFALNGDFVKVAVPKRQMLRKDHRLEGEVVKLIHRSTKPHIGVLVVRGRQIWAIVESKNMPYDIRIDVPGPDDLPEIGAPFAFGGRTYYVNTAEMSCDAEDTATVRLTGRTMNTN